MDNKVIGEMDYNNITVSHDGVAAKFYVSFNKNGKADDVKDYGVACQPGTVTTEVYKAVKLRKLKTKFPIHVLS